MLVAAEYLSSSSDKSITNSRETNCIFPVYSEGDQVKPQQIVTNALKHAKEEHLELCNH